MLEVVKVEKIFKQNPKEHNIMFGISYLSGIINYFHVSIHSVVSSAVLKKTKINITKVMFTGIKLCIDLCSLLKRKNGLENRVKAG